ncbi:MAG: hypothetical protein MRQ09_01340 [Candidatus Midichloria sp.]|nr:hypothetical protein [Candidatus Midichloria sp.]
MPENKELANVLRALSLDMVESANSGHPSLPLGFADVIMVLFKDFLKFNPHDPTWPNQERIILSCRPWFCLTLRCSFSKRVQFSIDDLRHFRQVHSKTPGHPEYNPNLGY